MPSERWTSQKHVEPFVDFGKRIERLRKWMSAGKKTDIVEALVDMAIGDVELLDQL